MRKAAPTTELLNLCRRSLLAARVLHRMMKAADFPAGVGQSRELIEDLEEAIGDRAAWRERAMDAVRHTCDRHASFTIDMVRARLAEAGHSTTQGTAMGQIMLMAAAAGWCERSGKFQYNAAHGSPRMIWNSRVYGDRSGK